MKHYAKRRKGSLLGLSLIIALVLAAIGASYVSMTTTNMKVAHANFTHHALLNPLESGADHAMLTLSKYLAASAPGGGWTNTATSVWTNSGWTPNGTGYSKVVNTAMELGNGRTSQVKVTVQNVPTLANQWNEPYLIVEAGANASANGATTYARQVAIKLKTRTLFDNGMVARKVVDLNGNSYSIDSYKSSQGAYNNPTNRGDNATVGTLEVINGISASGGEIFGNVASGGEDPTQDMSGAHIHGADSPPPYNVSGIDPARISTDFSADFPIKNYPSTGALAFPSANSGVYTLGTPGTTTVYKLPAGGLKLASETVNIQGNVIIVTDQDLSISGQGGISIPSDGTFKLYSSANVSIAGNGITNVSTAGTGTPKNCFIYGTSPTTQTITVAGNGAFSGVVYAPNADVTLSGGGSSGIFNGAIIAQNVTCNGGVQFHYDEDLSEITEPGYALDAWIELRGNKMVAMNGYGL